MIKNYLKIGFRNLLKHKANTLIHILGLAIGLAAFLLINQYVRFEKSYDSFHTNADQLYRVTTDILTDGVVRTQDANTYALAGTVIEEEIPEVIGSSTSRLMESITFEQNGKPIQEENVIAADENFLKIFDYKVLAGNPENLLKEPKTMVLTASYAKKYFGNVDPIGKTVNYLAFGTAKEPFMVTGVVADPPENTHYDFNMLISLSTTQERIERDGWSGNNYYGYLLLDEKASLTAVNRKIPELSRKYLDEDGDEMFNLQPVTDIHLHSDMTFEPTVHGSSRAVEFLRIISLFILFIAWINYINLSTARAVERAKEVGMRKVVGAQKSQLIGQFFMESLLVNTLGMILAVILTFLALPFFNELVGKTVLQNVWSDVHFVKSLFWFFGLGTLITGIYPAIVLSSFDPIGVIKGNFSKSKKGVWLRKNLVVFQFAASFVLIAGTMIVYQQLRYMTNQEMGMNTEQVLSFSNPEYDGDDIDQFVSKYNTFRNTLKQNGDIKSIASMGCLPGGNSSDINSADGKFSISGLSTPLNATVYLNFIDNEAVDVLGLEVIAGRAFQKEISSDTNTVLINESMLKLLNVPDAEAAVGQNFVREEGFKFRILGVIKDFNRSTLKYQVEPTFFLPSRVSSFGLAKLESKDLPATIQKIEEAYLSFFPGAAFDPIFLDQKFERLYKEDQKFGAVFSVFSILTIFVAIMGLFGLASFMSLQRTKEIGIRKVLGASIFEIVFMFFKDFVLLIGIGLIIGAPLVYLGMTEWLSGYAFRIDFPWWSMIISTLLLLIISFVTVSLHSFKAASVNPVESIKE